jgi:hypothetical protein
MDDRYKYDPDWEALEAMSIEELRGRNRLLTMALRVIKRRADDPRASDASGLYTAQQVAVQKVLKTKVRAARDEEPPKQAVGLKSANLRARTRNRR